MKILNVRLNHATNSSSTHSVILAGSAPNYSSEHGGEFGWNWFLQKTKDDKRAYMAQQLYGQLKEVIGVQAAVEVCKSFFGEAPNEDGHVDHQSTITLPKDIKGHPLVQFYKEMADDLINDNTVHIRGGNDNDESPEGGGTPHPRWGWLAALLEKQNVVARKNPDGVWSVYNRAAGTKMHLVFGNSDNIQLANYRPEYPELIDLKITDYCPYNCSFCYQDSTLNGKDGEYDELRYALWDMDKHSVFEVALGGGEPTKHPRFADLLKEAQKKVAVNLTTKNTRGEALLKNWNLINAYAVSIEDENDLKRAYAWHQQLEKELGAGPAFSAQYILDNKPMAVFEQVLEAMPYGPTLTLLGYKSVGRGGATPFRNDGWLAKAKKACKRIAIDTKLAQDYKDELKDVDPRLYYTEEGRFSMYIDAVAKKYGKSSYDSELIPYKDVREALAAFKTWK